MNDMQSSRARISLLQAQEMLPNDAPMNVVRAKIQTALDNIGDDWNDALDEIMDRLTAAEVELRKMIAAVDLNSISGQCEDDRLRGKLQGVQLAYDYARGMKH